ncbi:MAG: hypothetical protein EBV79_08490, partial [Betaproteobacteria bacterium]|nr:hypothetical protein [Betaproteobacteria bacterium]
MGGIQAVLCNVIADPGWDQRVDRETQTAPVANLGGAQVHEGHVQGCVVYRGALMSGTVAVRFERVEDPSIARWVASFAAATRWSGFLSFDFIVDESGVPHAIECNPRLTSGVHFFETADIAPAMVDPSAPLRLRKERVLQQFWPC